MQKKSSSKTSPKGKNVGFTLFAPEAQAASLAGDFNDWDVNSLPLKKDKRGSWKASVGLQPGRYEYRFWVDGEWYDDPGAHERAPNPFGSHNCIKFVF
jgi:1,4-alpha-glucan branching enzyme